MEIIEVRDDLQKKELLDYLPNVEWGESQVLTKAIKNDEIDEKLGKDAKIFYAKMCIRDRFKNVFTFGILKILW